MKKARTKELFMSVVFICISFNAFLLFAADDLEIIHNEGLLTVFAEEVMPENIFLELGRVCNIEIIVKGEKFPEKEVTLKLKDMPIKDAVKRLVKVCGIKNYLMDSKNDPQGKSRLVKIDLSVGGSGQRVLTEGEKKNLLKNLLNPPLKRSVADKNGIK